MGNGVHDELIRKKDALDALMAERKHLLDKGRWGAEHVLTHHGYNVIDELPPVQSDVPDIYAGELISRQAAIDAIYEDADWLAAQGSDWQVARMERDKSILKSLPTVQPKHGKWKPRYYDVGADTYVEWACSECGYVRQKGREDGNAGEELEADFCEKCGVKMER